MLNSLESVAAGIVAALADGPLPLGDFLLLASTSGLAIAVANNWNSIYTKWSSIISVFTNAFASISSDVEATFDEVQRNVSTYQNVPSISTNGKVASVAGVQYNCLVKASEMTQGQKQNNYYVAILFWNEVYFDSTRPITQGLARMIVAANHGYVGVLATNQSRASALAQPVPIGPECHGYGSSGYYYHYHNAMHRSCHIWFV